MEETNLDLEHFNIDEVIEMRTTPLKGKVIIVSTPSTESPFWNNYDIH